MAISQFKVNIPELELDRLRQKLKLTRLPVETVNWQDDNGITIPSIQGLVKFWLEEYDWRAEEALINEKLPQFMTKIEVDDGFGTLDVHFVHSKSKKDRSTPLLFVHGWPGSFIEITKGLDRLNEAGFDVVAPSLPGYGFSSYSRKEGFDIRKHAEVLAKLMTRLDYQYFVVQGGDWGSHITRAMGLLYPERIRAIHLNMLQLPDIKFPNGEPEYSEFEKQCIVRHKEWFMGTNSAYAFVQATKSNALGFAMHDSPVGMLAWMLDKLILWTDSYPWTPSEIITWTLLHYFPGPSTAFMMYHENKYPATVVANSWAQQYTSVPCGFSAFPKELAIMPRSWAETVCNVQFWREHETGGHFAMHEKPNELVDDMIEFYRSVLESKS